MGTFLIENSFGNVDTDGSLVLALHKVLCRQDRSDSYLIAYERTGNGNIDVINDNGTVAFPGWVRYANDRCENEKKKKIGNVFILRVFSRTKFILHWNS